MTSDVSHRSGGSVDADAGRYGHVRFGWYASAGSVPASDLAVSHRSDGETAIEHR